MTFLTCQCSNSTISYNDRIEGHFGNISFEFSLLECNTIHRRQVDHFGSYDSQRLFAFGPVKFPPDYQARLSFRA